MIDPTQTLSSQQTSFYDADLNLEISTKILYTYLGHKLQSIVDYDKCFGPISLRAKVLKDFIDKLTVAFKPILIGKIPLLQELFLLHQISRALDKYNQDVTKLNIKDFKTKIYFPNIVYILIRLLPNAKKFYQQIIKEIFNECNYNKYNNVIKFYNNLVDIDSDVIKSDILYNYLGNNLKKIDPFNVRGLKPFYKAVFRNIFSYYFKSENNLISESKYYTFNDIDLHDDSPNSNRLSIYRDVLLSLQIRKYCSYSPTMHQLNYNFNVFKNVILDNELQNIYFSIQTDIFSVKNLQYKVMKIYNDESHNNDLLKKIKELDLVYKLLKSVRIVSSKSKPYNENVIKAEMVKTAVLEELMSIFRNIISESYLIGILDRVSTNFVESILTGEYINLLTFSNVYINKLTFITQIRKFVRICLSEIVENNLDVEQ